MNFATSLQSLLNAPMTRKMFSKISVSTALLEMKNLRCFSAVQGQLFPVIIY